MGTTERRQAEKEMLRKKIIHAASEILGEEGYKNLSIRKIARHIGYSPGIIYHYFKDKGEVVASVVEEGYGEILKCIKEVSIDVENPEETIKKTLRQYMERMLENPEQFRAILLNDMEEIQEKVNMLSKGSSKERKSIQGLCRLLSLGMEKGKF